MAARAEGVTALKRGCGAQTATGGPEWRVHAPATTTTTASACAAHRLDDPLSRAGPGRDNTRQVAHVVRYLSVGCRTTTPDDVCTAVSHNVVIYLPLTLLIQL